MLFFLIGDSKSEGFALCYMHLPYLKDGIVEKEEGNGDSEAKVKIEKILPDDASAPKPYYTQPYAEAAADVVDKKHLKFIPPTNSHTNDYMLSMDDCFLVVVGEAESAGSSMQDERVKSMLGVLRVLNVYDHAIDMVSGNCLSEIDFHKVTTQRGSGGLRYPVVMSKRLSSEDEYTKFIMKMLEGLQVVLSFWVKEYQYKSYKVMSATCPTTEPEGVESKNERVNISGVYLGDNIGWVQECGDVMMDLFHRGADNEEKEIGYLFNVLGGNTHKESPSFKKYDC